MERGKEGKEEEGEGESVSLLSDSEQRLHQSALLHCTSRDNHRSPP